MSERQWQVGAEVMVDVVDTVDFQTWIGAKGEQRDGTTWYRLDNEFGGTSWPWVGDDFVTPEEWEAKYHRKRPLRAESRLLG